MPTINPGVLLAIIYNVEVGSNQLISANLNRNLTEVLVTYHNFSQFQTSILSETDDKVYSVMPNQNGFFMLITELNSRTYSTVKLDDGKIPIWMKEI